MGGCHSSPPWLRCRQVGLGRPVLAVTPPGKDSGPLAPAVDGPSP
jgi:hypothetical protein